MTLPVPAENATDEALPPMTLAPRGRVPKAPSTRRSGLQPSADATLRGRIGAYRLHATHDSRALTQAARQAFLSRFEREVDPDGILDPAERERRAAYARREYFARLAYASAKRRRA